MVGTAVSLLAAVGLEINARYQADKFEGPTEEFLTYAGFNPVVARQLSNHDNQAVGAAPRLVAFAEENGISQTQLLTWLNQQDSDFLKEFITEALHPVQPQDGEYTISSNEQGHWSFNQGWGYYTDGDIRLNQVADARPGDDPTDPNIWDRAASAEALTIDGIPNVAGDEWCQSK